MTSTVTITTVIKTDELKQFSRDLSELIRVVKAANGRYVLYVDKVKSATTQNAFISMSDFDNAISLTMATHLHSQRRWLEKSSYPIDGTLQTQHILENRRRLS